MHTTIPSIQIVIIRSIPCIKLSHDLVKIKLGTNGNVSKKEENNNGTQYCNVKYI
jgi:hypothetical protein